MLMFKKNKKSDRPRVEGEGENQVIVIPPGYKDVPLFKVEHSLFEMMLDGRKQWDARIWDVTDDRIRRLSAVLKTGIGRDEFLEKSVAFLDKATGQVVAFELLGVTFPYEMEKHIGDDASTTWGLMKLGKRLA